MPKVSIIVPVYNKEKYLERSLNSLMNQSLEDIEIILIDDGSSDNSLELCKTFQKKDNRIKVIPQQNQGVSVARNTGIKHATGEYIGFTDPDDWVEKDMFLKMYKKSEETNSSVCISNYSQDTKDNTIKQELNVTKDILDSKDIDEQILSKLIGPLKVGESTIMSTVWRLLIKRELIIDNNITFPKGIHRMQDLSFSIETLIYADQLCVVRDHLYHYKVHDDSASSIYDVNTFEELIKILPIVEKIIEKHNIDFDTKYRINNRYLYIGMKSISNEAKQNNPNTFMQALNNIKEICSHKKVQDAVNNMDISQYSFKEKVIFNSIKNKNSLVLFGYYRITQIIFH